MCFRALKIVLVGALTAPGAESLTILPDVKAKEPSHRSGLKRLTVNGDAGGRGSNLTLEIPDAPVIQHHHLLTGSPAQDLIPSIFDIPPPPSLPPPMPPPMPPPPPPSIPPPPPPQPSHTPQDAHPTSPLASPTERRQSNESLNAPGITPSSSGSRLAPGEPRRPVSATWTATSETLTVAAARGGRGGRHTFIQTQQLRSPTKSKDRRLGGGGRHSRISSRPSETQISPRATQGPGIHTADNAAGRGYSNPPQSPPQSPPSRTADNLSVMDIAVGGPFSRFRMSDRTGIPRNTRKFYILLEHPWFAQVYQ